MGANVSSSADQRNQVADLRAKKQLRRTPSGPRVSPFVQDNPRVTEIKSKDQWKARFNALKDSDKLLVIDFTAKWCGPCNSIEPKIEEFAAIYTNVEFVKIDVDALMGLSMKFNVNTLPAMVFMKRGQELDRVVGVNVDELRSKIEKYMQPSY
ncbi:PREDICTED: thioredoxin H8 [Tarenaya hassleriana]|uniref:thioredoxin H8 n=1 Tax=Tarenaya hassleriana TaxID=28532 RepID=UPI00053C6D2B|nr:PREDICTED: thioredoxin H8 [Tarenaya hassleriana]